MMLNDETDGFEAISQFCTVRRQRLHQPLVQLAVIIAGLETLVSSLLDVAEELKKDLDEATAVNGPDE